MKTKGLKGVFAPYKELEKDGFDFNVFKYKANLICEEKKKIVVYREALIMDEMAVLVNKDKTQVFIIRLSENKHLKIERLDSEEVN
jgi:hypothetical protein